jgi:hypothetical protein
MSAINRSMSVLPQERIRLVSTRSARPSKGSTTPNAAEADGCARSAGTTEPQSGFRATLAEPSFKATNEHREAGCHPATRE